MVAVKGHQQSSSRVDPLDKPFETIDFYQVAILKRILNTDEDTRQEILHDVTKCDTKDQPEQPGSTDHRHRQS